MKKNILAVLRSAVLAAAIIIPISLQGIKAPQTAATYTVASQSRQAAVPETASEPGAVKGDPVTGGPDGELEYVSCVMIVGLSEDVTVEQFNERLSELDYVATKVVSEDDPAFGYTPVELADGVDVDDAMAFIESEDVVSSAEPNYILHVQDESADDALYAATSLQAGAIADELEVKPLR